MREISSRLSPRVRGLRERRPLRIGLTMLAAATLGACAQLVPPREVAPAQPPELPVAWSSTGAAVHAQWWTVFNDARLNALVQEALSGSAGVRQALARVEEARAAARLAGAQTQPIVNAQASVLRQSTSGATPPNPGVTNNVFGAGIQASWEADLWGRQARELDAARADLAAATIDVEATRLLLAAEVARSYFTLLSLDAQAATLRRSITQQREALDLQRRRAEAGVLSDYELRQLEAEIASVEASLPSLVQAREQAQTALLVLLGRSPKAVLADQLDLTAAQGAASAPAPQLPAGLPSELLLRRPDLALARQRLLAADARADAIRLSAFPSVTLTGNVGTQAGKLSDLFSGPSFVWSLGANLVQTLFEGGRREATDAVYRARREQALLQWQAAISQAFGDVRSALAAQAASADGARAQRERIVALQRVLDLARLRFANGVASQLDVLDAERNLLAARGALVLAEQAQRNALVDLMKALGGGWSATAS